MRAVRGEWISALHLLDATLAVAPDDMRRGLIFVDRARIHHAANEESAAAASRQSALSCFERVDWSRALRDEAMGIFGAMDVLVLEPDRARALFEAAVRVRVSVEIGGGHGKRLHAFRLYAESYLAGGDFAFKSAQEAYRAFKSVKYLGRSASCALRIVELGGGARWRSRVERFIERYPHSLVARQYARINSPLATLPHRTYQVARLLASTNQSTKEIATALGMAEATVRVHVRTLHHRLNIRNRSDLVRLFMRSTPAA